MIGLIIWAILIIFIVICACPGFITAFIVGSVIALCGYGLINWLIWWVKGGRFKRENRVDKTKSYLDTIAEQEREKAIDEWERKWRRKHPCRK